MDEPNGICDCPKPDKIGEKCNYCGGKLPLDYESKTKEIKVKKSKKSSPKKKAVTQADP